MYEMTVLIPFLSGRGSLRLVAFQDSLICRLNPLFIGSWFSPDQVPDYQRLYAVLIPFLSGRGSLQETHMKIVAWLCLNPLFIGSWFSPPQTKHTRR